MISKFFVAYWQYVVITALIASNIVTGNLWWEKVTELAEYKAEVRANGKAAEAEVKKVKDKQDENLKELSYAYAKAVPAVQANAVANYLRMHPNSVRRSAGRGSVPAPTNSPQGATGADGAGISTAPQHAADAGLPACQPDAEFIQRCAGAVSKVGLCRDWIQRNGFPIEH